MAEHLRFSVAYWHTFRNGNADPFGAPTRLMPWDNGSNSVENAQNRVRAAFEFMEKLGVPFYCFHDRDVSPEGETLAETNKNLDAVATVMKEEQQKTGVKLLWGTANLFSHPRYMHGAATSCNADVFAFAAAQVAKAMEMTQAVEWVGICFLGWPRGLQNSAQYQHETGTGSPRQISSDGGRLQKTNRIHWPVFYRA